MRVAKGVGIPCRVLNTAENQTKMFRNVTETAEHR